MAAPKTSLPQPPAIPVIVRWLQPDSEKFAHGGLAVATVFPTVPRVGEFLHVPPPAKKAGEDYAVFAAERSSENVVRAVRYDWHPHGLHPHSAHGWVINVFLDAFRR